MILIYQLVPESDLLLEDDDPGITGCTGAGKQEYTLISRRPEGGKWENVESSAMNNMAAQLSAVFPW